MAEPATAEHGVDPAAQVAVYERLREAVLSGQPQGWRFGHGVFAGRGMAAWMAAWAAAPASPAGTPALDPSAPSTPSSSTATASPLIVALSSLPHAGEIVAVLAQMALAHA